MNAEFTLLTWQYTHSRKEHHTENISKLPTRQ